MSRPISSRSTAGSAESDFVFQLADDPLLLFFGQVVEVVGNAAFDLLLAVGFGIFENFLAAVAHALQAAADGIDRRRHAALQHRHREADGAAAGGCRRRRLPSTDPRRSGSARRKNRVPRRRDRRRPCGLHAW